jgi:hypothetical protein
MLTLDIVPDKNPVSIKKQARRYKKYMFFHAKSGKVVFEFDNQQAANSVDKTNQLRIMGILVKDIQPSDSYEIEGRIKPLDCYSDNESDAGEGSEES